MAYTMELERDRTFEKAMTFKANDVVVNLAGKVIVFHLRKVGAKVDFLTLSTSDTEANPNGSRLVYTNQTGGAFSLLLTDEETKLLTFDSGTFSLSLEYSGRKDDLGGGKVKISNP